MILKAKIGKNGLKKINSKKCEVKLHKNKKPKLNIYTEMTKSTIIIYLKQE